MNEEYLDIVDENDQVIGKDTRDNVHKNFQIHRGIHVLVINSKREILIQKRSTNKSYYPGYYDASVGAQVQSGESYEDTAKRETQEELGFTPLALTKICDYKSYSTRQRENRRLFVCLHEGPFNFDHNELETVDFISPTKIQKMVAAGKPFTEGFTISFKHYLKSISMKTILVDAVGTFVIEGEGIFQPMFDLLEQYPNKKIILTNANDEQMVKFGLTNLPYELYTLKHNPDKTDPRYFEQMLKHFNLLSEDVVYFEHNLDAVKSAQSVGMISHHYDSNRRDLKSLKLFLNKHALV